MTTWMLFPKLIQSKLPTSISALTKVITMTKFKYFYKILTKKWMKLYFFKCNIFHWYFFSIIFSNKNLYFDREIAWILFWIFKLLNKSFSNNVNGGNELTNLFMIQLRLG